MRLYPENNIIVLPQTVHYESNDIFAEDINKMNQHHHLTICARDNHSAELLRQKGFTGQLMTLPDMAFCINPQELQADMTTETTRQNLILLREDKELKEKKQPDKYVNASFSDWPNIKKSSEEAWDFLMTHNNSETDSFFIEEFFPREIKAGIKFVSSFKEVSSTRLHVAILRLLLGLPVKMIDNSYGKNFNFYNTWLKDSELVGTPDEKEQEAIDFAIYIHRHEQESLQESLLKCKKDYEMQIAALKDRQQKQEMSFEKIRHEQEATIASLRKSSEQESQKHKKYKVLFNISLLLMFLFILMQILILNI